MTNKTGTGTAEKNKFREFEAMDEMLGTRPGHNIGGIDSSKPSGSCNTKITYSGKNNVI